MILLESLELLLKAEDEEILKAFHDVKSPPVKRMSYVDVLHPSEISPQPDVEIVEPSDLRSRKELFLGLDLVNSLYDISSPDEARRKTEEIIESLKRRESVKPEDHPKTHIALALPEKENLGAVKGKWRDHVWKPVTYDGEEAPDFDSWVRDLLAIADALKAEGLRVTFYGGRSTEILKSKSSYDIVEVELKKELPKLGYPRDPSVAWSCSPIIMNMTLDERRGEENAASQFFRKIGLNPSFRPRWWFDGRHLVRARAEGGNFIIVRGRSGLALFTGIGIRGSNKAAIELIKEYLSLKEIELDIYGVPLPGYIRDWRTGAVHLDVVMMNAGPCVILSPGRMGFYSFLKFKAEVDFVEAGRVFKELEVEVDEIPAKGSEITLVNALNLGKGKLVVDAYNEEASKYLEKEWGLDLIRVRIPQVEAGGGGVRCASREYYPEG